MKIWQYFRKLCSDFKAAKVEKEAKKRNELAAFFSAESQKYSKQGDFQKGLAYANRAIVLDPGEWLYYYLAGFALSGMKRYAEAYHPLSLAVQLKEDIASLVALVVCCLYLWKFDQALSCFERALLCKGAYRWQLRDAWGYKVVTFQRMGRINQAKIECMRARRDFPDEPHFMMLEANFLVRENKIDEAERAYGKLLERFPKDEKVNQIVNAFYAEVYFVKKQAIRVD